ncbi:MAG: CPBP family glutamic-type intramembrane protease, partial [bacterium]
MNTVFFVAGFFFLYKYFRIPGASKIRWEPLFLAFAIYFIEKIIILSNIHSTKGTYYYINGVQYLLYLTSLYFINKNIPEDSKLYIKIRLNSKSLFSRIFDVVMMFIVIAATINAAVWLYIFFAPDKVLDFSLFSESIRDKIWLHFNYHRYNLLKRSIFAPIYEEIFYRGFLFQNFSRYFSRRVTFLF